MGLSKYEVQIIEVHTGEVIKRFAPQCSERAAQKLERGVQINLNHEKYVTDIVEVRT